MNPENYGSREACERLFKAGIVLETDFWWNQDENGEWRLIPYEHCHRNDGLQVLQVVPALSLAEAWRELPNNVLPEALNGLIRCRFDKTKEEDYLIDLLIWVRKEKKNES